MVAAVARAAPFIPRVGMSRIFNTTFNIAQTALMRKGICTFPMLDSVAPTAPKDAPIAYPGSSISSGTYDTRYSSVKRRAMIYGPETAMSVALPTEIRKLFFSVE